MMEVYTPESQDHAEMETLIEQAKTDRAQRGYDYDEMVRHYNQMPQDSFLISPDGATQSRGNLTIILVNRGGIEGEDFEVYKPRRDKDGNTIPAELRRLVIRKISSKSLRLTNPQ